MEKKKYTLMNLCRNFYEGTCNELVCHFAHGEEQLHPKSQYFYKTCLCHFNEGRRCTKDKYCFNAHGAEELRNHGESPNKWRKSVLCWLNMKGRCGFDSAVCMFAHGPDDLRRQERMAYKTELCEAYQKGQCHLGAWCYNAHGEEELQTKGEIEERQVAEMKSFQDEYVSDGFCSLCSVRNQTTKSMEEHGNSMKHKRKKLLADPDTYYKTMLCPKLEKCNCPICLFAHNADELRTKEENLDSINAGQKLGLDPDGYFDGLRCILCDESVKNVTGIAGHLDSKAHKTCQKNMDPGGLISGMYCTLCETTFDMFSQIIVHLKENHTEKYTPGEIYYQGAFLATHCLVCGITVKHAVMVPQHLQSEMHLNCQWCVICDCPIDNPGVTVEGTGSLERHLLGEAHKKTLATLNKQKNRLMKVGQSKKEMVKYLNHGKDSRYKTELCKTQNCLFEFCQFAHGAKELRTAPENRASIKAGLKLGLDPEGYFCDRWCLLCDESVPYYATIPQHFKGRKHLEARQRLDAINISAGLRCIVCDVTFTEFSLLVTHLKKTHCKQVSHQGAFLDLLCVLCNLRVYSAAGILSHLQSKRHKEARWCAICDCPIDDSDGSVESHLLGRRHNNRIKYSWVELLEMSENTSSPIKLGADSLFKTKLCANYLNSKCDTEHCQHAHGVEQLRSIPENRESICAGQKLGLDPEGYFTDRICIVCDYGVPTFVDIPNHLKSKKHAINHQRQRERLDPNGYISGLRCSSCDISFESFSQVISHLLEAHPSHTNCEGAPSKPIVIDSDEEESPTSRDIIPAAMSDSGERRSRGFVLSHDLSVIKQNDRTYDGEKRGEKRDMCSRENAVRDRYHHSDDSKTAERSGYGRMDDREYRSQITASRDGGGRERRTSHERDQDGSGFSHSNDSLFVFRQKSDQVGSGDNLPLVWEKMTDREKIELQKAQSLVEFAKSYSRESSNPRGSSASSRQQQQQQQQHQPMSKTLADALDALRKLRREIYEKQRQHSADDDYVYEYDSEGSGSRQRRTSSGKRKVSIDDDDDDDCLVVYQSSNKQAKTTHENDVNENEMNENEMNETFPSSALLPNSERSTTSNGFDDNDGDDDAASLPVDSRDNVDCVIEASTSDHTPLLATRAASYFSQFGSLVWCEQAAGVSTVRFKFADPSLNQAVLYIEHSIYGKTLSLKPVKDEREQQQQLQRQQLQKEKLLKEQQVLRQQLLQLQNPKSSSSCDPNNMENAEPILLRSFSPAISPAASKDERGQLEQQLQQQRLRVQLLQQQADLQQQRKQQQQSLSSDTRDLKNVEQVRLLPSCSSSSIFSAASRDEMGKQQLQHQQNSRSSYSRDLNDLE